MWVTSDKQVLESNSLEGDRERKRKREGINSMRMRGELYFCMVILSLSLSHTHTHTRSMQLELYAARCGSISLTSTLPYHPSLSTLLRCVCVCIHRANFSSFSSSFSSSILLPSPSCRHPYLPLYFGLRFFNPWNIIRRPVWYVYSLQMHQRSRMFSHKIHVKS